jgi:hypothetical protein
MNIHKDALNSILNRGGGQGRQGNEDVNRIVAKDKEVRQAIADLYMLLNGAGNPKMAIELLADHVAIMIDMINEMKKQAGIE